MLIQYVLQSKQCQSTTIKVERVRRRLLGGIRMLGDNKALNECGIHGKCGTDTIDFSE